MILKKIEIVNQLGLHARAAAKFVTTAAHYASEIHVIKDGTRVNGKSIMGIMMLAAAKGSFLEIEVDGTDQLEAFEALATLIKNRFDEEA